MRKIILSLIFLIFLFPNTISALELTLISNTDHCIYHPDIGKDFCQSIYKISDIASYDAQKLKFLYKTDRMQDFLPSISGSDATLSVKKTGSEYIINITAYKNPFLNVDNVPCYDNKCFYKYAWWNSSFYYKYPINGSTESGIYQGMVLVNDSNITLPGGNILIWCNLSVNATRSIIGWLYFNDSDNYACSNPEQTETVALRVDEGGGSNYKYPNDDLILWANLSGSGDDASHFRFASDKYGTIVPIIGVVGNGMSFTGGYYDFGDHDEFNGYGGDPDGYHGLTVMAWTNPTYPGPAGVTIIGKGGIGGQNFAYELLYESVGCMRFCGFISGVYRCASSAANQANYNYWAHIAGTYDNNYLRFYINGNLTSSAYYPGVLGDSGPENLQIGAGVDGLDGMTGSIDDARIYNRTLTADEIRSIYDNTIGNRTFAPLGDYIMINESEINLTPPDEIIMPSLDIKDKFCFNDDYLYISEPCPGNCSFSYYLERCEYGCSNSTFWDFGGAGCKESPMVLIVIAFVVIFIGIFLYERFLR